MDGDEIALFERLERSAAEPTIVASIAKAARMTAEMREDPALKLDEGVAEDRLEELNAGIDDFIEMPVRVTGYVTFYNKLVEKYEQRYVIDFEVLFEGFQYVKNWDLFSEEERDHYEFELFSYEDAPVSKLAICMSAAVKAKSLYPNTPELVSGVWEILIDSEAKLEFKDMSTEYAEAYLELHRPDVLSQLREMLSATKVAERVLHLRQFMLTFRTNPQVSTDQRLAAAIEAYVDGSIGLEEDVPFLIRFNGEVFEMNAEGIPSRLATQQTGQEEVLFSAKHVRLEPDPATFTDETFTSWVMYLEGRIRGPEPGRDGQPALYIINGIETAVSIRDVDLTKAARRG